MRTITAAVVGAIVAGAGSSAMAQQPILTFGFTDLSGSFNVQTGQFSAVGVDQADLRTSGDVSRIQDPVGTAVYAPGDGVNRVAVDLLVSAVMPTTANGTGSLTITDLDGDTLTADISGQFIANGPAVFFNGVISNPVFQDNGTPDMTFDGPGGGSFLRTFGPAVGPYTGAIVQLYLGTAGAFFTQNFSGVSTQVSGAIVPAPATLGLLGFGLLAAGRRRRA